MKGKKKTKSPQEAADTIVEEAVSEVSGEVTEEAPMQEDAATTPDYEAQFNQAQDRYQRTLAEFDNFRKRTAKEISARYEDGLRAAAEKLLPIVDNFERAMNASENKEDNFYQGIAMISRQLDAALTDIGLAPITEEPGTAFDHNLHHAVAHIEDEAFGQNVIAEVLQKGYKHRDRVIRPSMVKVAN